MYTEYDNLKLVRPINWNRIEDEMDNTIWKRATANIWLPEAIDLTGDLDTWCLMSPEEKTATVRVLTGLTLLDTIQSTIGIPSLIPHAQTQHEEAVLTQFQFLESVHAKSYSTIFSTLCTSEEIDEAMDWGLTNKYLINKQNIIRKYYEDVQIDPLKRKIASTFLESFMFYSGFFLPIYWASRNRLPATADMIRLIIRDEAVHGFYIGYKHQLELRQRSPEEQKELLDFAHELFQELYDNEVEYTRYIYDSLGLTDHVIGFLRYNANKAFQNLGFEEPFEPSEVEILPEILSGINVDGGATHDFFSTKGSNYVMGASRSNVTINWDDEDYDDF